MYQLVQLLIYIFKDFILHIFLYEELIDVGTLLAHQLFSIHFLLDMSIISRYRLLSNIVDVYLQYQVMNYKKLFIYERDILH